MIRGNLQPGKQLTFMSLRISAVCSINPQTSILVALGNPPNGFTCLYMTRSVNDEQTQKLANTAKRYMFDIESHDES